MMAECLHLYFSLKAGFELEGKVIIVDRDLFNQLPDQPFVVLRHLGGLLRRKGFELIHPLLHACAVGLFDQQVLLLFPERVDLVGQFLEALLGVGLLQELFLQGLQPLVDQYFFLNCRYATFPITI